MTRVRPHLDLPSAWVKRNPVVTDVGNRDTLCAGDGQIIQPAIDHTQHAAVGDDKQTLSGVRASQPIDCRVHARMKRGAGFAFRQREF